MRVMQTRIRELREKLGLTQEALAEKVERGSTTLPSGWPTG